MKNEMPEMKNGQFCTPGTLENEFGGSIVFPSPSIMIAPGTTVLTLATLLISAAINFLVRAMVARELGPELTGIYVLVIVTFNLTALAIGVGMPVFNSCFAQKKSFAVLVSNSLLWSGMGLIGIVILWGGTWVLKGLGFGVEHPEYLGLAMFMAPVGLLIEAWRSLFQGRGKIGHYNSVQLISVLVNGGLLIIMLYVLHWELFGALVSWAVSLGIALAVAFLFIWHEGALCFSWNRDIFSHALRFGSQVWLGQFVGLLNFRLVLFLVQFLLGRESIGFYAVAMAMAEILYFIPGAIGISLLPRLSVARGPEAARMVAAGCRHSLYANLFLALVLAGSGGLLIKGIFTKAFEPSILPLLLLIPGVFTYGLAHITTTYFNAYVGRPMINTLVAGFSVLMQSISIILLVPLMGMAGAALGTSVGYIIAIGVNFAIFRWMTGIKLREVFLLKRGDLHVYKGYLNSLRVQMTR